MSKTTGLPLPPPVDGGTGSYGSRGRFIDWLMGDQRIRARARDRYEALFGAASENDGGPQPSPPDEPPPTQLPPPVPDGTGSETRGARNPERFKPRQAR